MHNVEEISQWTTAFKDAISLNFKEIYPPFFVSQGQKVREKMSHLGQRHQSIPETDSDTPKIKIKPLTHHAIQIHFITTC